jgi:hypothetical protein
MNVQEAITQLTTITSTVVDLVAELGGFKDYVSDAGEQTAQLLGVDNEAIGKFEAANDALAEAIEAAVQVQTSLETASTALVSIQ